MTVSPSPLERRTPTRWPSPRTLRAAAWALHVAITVLAVLSLLCRGFHTWIDLRMLGSIPAALTKIFWVGTVLVVPWSAGPRLAGFRRPTWVNNGWSAAAARYLLWPTYFVLACLLANTLYYYRLLALGQIDAAYPLPITFLAALLLAAWVLLTREWLRAEDRRPDMSPTRRSSQFRALACGLPIAAFASAFFLLHAYARPLAAPVDLAVVLGNRVLPDGSASVTLRDRTLAAVNLYHAGLVQHLFLSGAVWPPRSPAGPPMDEPAAMRQVCLDHGIPDDALTLDPVGENTRATAFDAARFMHDHAYTTAVVCTDQYHLYRTAKCFRQAGIDARTAPARPTQWQCADPFATAREFLAIALYTLKPSYHLPGTLSMKLTDPRILVRKTAGILELYDGPRLIKKYACITGGNPGDKAVEGDRRTPIGLFHVVYKNPDSKFHLSLGLDYPRPEDAQRGLQSGLITQDQYDAILAALHSDLSLKENQDKLWYTPLGGEIFIHGHAENRASTAGCIALSNPDIDELYPLVPLATPIEIRP